MKDKILVVKYGSSSVSGVGGVDHAKLAEYASKIKDLSAEYKIVIVSSGAVMAGKAITGDSNSIDASIYAMVGSAIIVVAWQDAFRQHSINVGQILVTHNDIAGKIEGSRLQSVIHDALSKEIIPIINENDILSDIELAKISYGGDNDGLASKIAVTIGATELLLLTNVDGLLDENGVVISSVDSDNLKIAIDLASGKSDNGRGGMRSKIEAAVLANKVGVSAHIGNAATDYQLLISKVSGTHIK